jgi:putative oxidoreductase
LIVGLFTRLAAIPLIITAFVIMGSVNNFDVIGKNDISLAIMVAFVVILILGPGKYSLDNLLSK